MNMPNLKVPILMKGCSSFINDVPKRMAQITAPEHVVDGFNRVGSQHNLLVSFVSAPSQAIVYSKEFSYGWRNHDKFAVESSKPMPIMGLEISTTTTAPIPENWSINLECDLILLSPYPLLLIVHFPNARLIRVSEGQVCGCREEGVVNLLRCSHGVSIKESSTPSNPNILAHISEEVRPRNWFRHGCTKFMHQILPLNPSFPIKSEEVIPFSRMENFLPATFDSWAIAEKVEDVFLLPTVKFPYAGLLCGLFHGPQAT